MRTRSFHPSGVLLDEAGFAEGFEDAVVELALVESFGGLGADGYERHNNPEVVEPINVLAKGAYGQLLNYFHASLKLKRKERPRRRWRACWPAQR